MAAGAAVRRARRRRQLRSAQLPRQREPGPRADLARGTDQLESASDDWFADVKGSGSPSFAIGRLPVRTVDEARLVADKIVAYEASNATLDPATLVTDLDGGLNFQRMTTAVADELPAGLSRRELTRGETPDDQLQTMLIQALDDGSGVVSLVGLGSIDLWRGGLLDSDSAAALDNGAKLPLFTMANCLNAAFQDPFLSSLGESLLLAPAGGGVAVWASTGSNRAGAQDVLMQEFYRQLFHSGRQNPTLGEAALAAKHNISGDLGYVSSTWMLLGDPATRLHQAP